MFKAFRVGIVAEGPTDVVVLAACLEAALQARLSGRQLVVRQVYPDESRMFGQGWKGVVKYAASLAERAAMGSVLPANLDLLVVHLDGEVANEPIMELSVSCPPASAAANELRSIVLFIMGLDVASEPRVVVSVPCQDIEAWLVPLYRQSEISDCAEGIAAVECMSKPAHLFQGGKPKLARFKNGELSKKTAEYRAIAPHIAKMWPTIRQLSQALRFEQDLLGCPIP